MDFNNFWLQSNNGKKYQLDDLKNLKPEDIAKNEKLKKLVNIFDKNKNGTIDEGEEWEAILGGLKKAAKDDNILTEEEFEEFAIENNLEDDITIDTVNELLDAATGEVSVETVGDDEITRVNGIIAQIITTNEDGTKETKTYNYTASGVEIISGNKKIEVSEVDENGKFNDEDFKKMTFKDDKGHNVVVDFVKDDEESIYLSETTYFSDTEKLEKVFNTDSFYLYDLLKKTSKHPEAMQVYTKGNDTYCAKTDGKGNTYVAIKSGDYGKKFFDRVNSDLRKMGKPEITWKKFLELNKDINMGDLHLYNGKQYSGTLLIPGIYNANDPVIVNAGTIEANSAQGNTVERERRYKIDNERNHESYTLEKDYKGNFQALAKDLNVDANELKYCNPLAQLYAGEVIIVPRKLTNSNTSPEIINAFPVKENKNFYIKYNKLNDRQKQQVLQVIQNTKQTDTNKIKAEIYKATGINFYDSDLFIKKDKQNSNDTVPLEYYLINTLKLDISNGKGQKIYMDLTVMPSLESITTETDLATIESKINKVYQDFNDSKTLEGRERLQQRQEKTELKSVALNSLKNIYINQKNEIENYLKSIGFLDVGYWVETLGKVASNKAELTAASLEQKGIKDAKEKLKNMPYYASCASMIKDLNKQINSIDAVLNDSDIMEDEAAFSESFSKLTGGATYNEANVKKYIETINNYNLFKKSPQEYTKQTIKNGKYGSKDTPYDDKTFNEQINMSYWGMFGSVSKKEVKNGKEYVTQYDIEALKTLPYQKNMSENLAVFQGINVGGNIAAMLMGTEAIAKTTSKAYKWGAKEFEKLFAKNALRSKTARLLKASPKVRAAAQGTLQSAKSGGDFALWNSAYYTGQYLAHREDMDYSYGEGLWKTAKEGFAFGTYAGLFGRFITTPLVAKVLGNPATEATTKKAMEAVSKQIKTGQNITGSQLVETYQQAYAKAASSAGQEILSFGMEILGFSAYEIANNLLARDEQIIAILKQNPNKTYTDEEIEELLNDTQKLKAELKTCGASDEDIKQLTEIQFKDVFTEQLKTLTSFKSVGKLLYMRRGRGMASGKNMGIDKSQDLKIKPIKENGKDVFEISSPNGDKITLNSLDEAMRFVNEYNEQITVYDPIDEELDRSGFVDLRNGTVLSKNNGFYEFKMENGTVLKDKNLKNLIQIAQTETIYYEYEQTIAKKGSVKLPNDQVITLDKENNLYKTSVEGIGEIDAASVKELITKTEYKKMFANIEGRLQGDQDSVVLDNRTIITKDENGIYTIIIAKGKGKLESLTGNSVEEIFEKLSQKTSENELNDLTADAAVSEDSVPEDLEFIDFPEIPAEQTLSERIASADSREDFAAIKDEIKKLPVGKERNQIIKECQAKYNEWKKTAAGNKVSNRYRGTEFKSETDASTQRLFDEYAPTETTSTEVRPQAENERPEDLLALPERTTTSSEVRPEAEVRPETEVKDSINPNEKLYSHEDNIKAINHLKNFFKEAFSDVTEEIWNNIANELAMLKEKYDIEPEGSLKQNQIPQYTNIKEQLGNDNHIRLQDEENRVFKFDRKTGKLISITIGDNKIIHFKPNGTIYSMNETTIIPSKEIVFEFNGEKITHEQFLKSKVPGQYTIYETQPNGKKYIIGLAEMMPNGGKSIEQNVRSLDGTKTDFIYQDDASNNRILYKRITSPDGKVLFETKKTYKVLSENHYQTSTDEQYYDILITNDKVLVTKLDKNKKPTNEAVEYHIADLSGTKIDWNKEYENEDARINDIFKQLGISDYEFVIDKRVLNTFKLFAGDEWFKLAQSGTKLLYGDCDIENNAVNSISIIGISKGLYGDSPTAAHETGHSVFNMLDLENDAELRKIYEAEKEEITAMFPDNALKIISYMLKGNENNARGLNELVAETNLMNSMPQENEIYAQRTVLLQQYFPKTIAYISNKINKINSKDINNNNNSKINNHEKHVKKPEHLGVTESNTERTYSPSENRPLNATPSADPKNSPATSKPAAPKTTTTTSPAVATKLPSVEIKNEPLTMDELTPLTNRNGSQRFNDNDKNALIALSKQYPEAVRELINYTAKVTDTESIKLNAKYILTLAPEINKPEKRDTLNDLLKLTEKNGLFLLFRFQPEDMLKLTDALNNPEIKDVVQDILDVSFTIRGKDYARFKNADDIIKLANSIKDSSAKDTVLEFAKMTVTGNDGRIRPRFSADTLIKLQKKLENPEISDKVKALTEHTVKINGKDFFARLKEEDLLKLVDALENPEISDEVYELALLTVTVNGNEYNRFKPDDIIKLAPELKITEIKDIITKYSKEVYDKDGQTLPRFSAKDLTDLAKDLQNPELKDSIQTLADIKISVDGKEVPRFDGYDILQLAPLIKDPAVREIILDFAKMTSESKGKTSPRFKLDELMDLAKALKNPDLRDSIKLLAGLKANINGKELNRFNAASIIKLAPALHNPETGDLVLKLAKATVNLNGKEIPGFSADEILELLPALTDPEVNDIIFKYAKETMETKFGPKARFNTKDLAALAEQLKNPALRDNIDTLLNMKINFDGKELPRFNTDDIIKLAPALNNPKIKNTVLELAKITITIDGKNYSRFNADGILKLAPELDNPEVKEKVLNFAKTLDTKNLMRFTTDDLVDLAKGLKDPNLKDNIEMLANMTYKMTANGKDIFRLNNSKDILKLAEALNNPAIKDNVLKLLNMTIKCRGRYWARFDADGIIKLAPELDKPELKDKIQELITETTVINGKEVTKYSAEKILEIAIASNDVNTQKTVQKIKDMNLSPHVNETDIYALMSVPEMDFDTAVSIISKIDTPEKVQILDSIYRASRKANQMNALEIDNLLESIAENQVPGIENFICDVISSGDAKKLNTTMNYLLLNLCDMVNSKEVITAYKNIRKNTGFKNMDCSDLTRLLSVTAGYKYTQLDANTNIQDLHNRIKSQLEAAGFHSVDAVVSEYESYLPFVEDEKILEFLANQDYKTFSPADGLQLLKISAEAEGTLYIPDSKNSQFNKFSGFLNRNDIDYDNLLEYNIPKSINFKNELGVPLDMEMQVRFQRLRNYIGLNPNTEMSNYLYTEVYLRNLKDFGFDDQVITELKAMDTEYGVKIFIGSDTRKLSEVMTYIKEELNEWKTKSNGKAKLPPYIDFNSAQWDWYDNTSAHGQGVSAAYSAPFYNGALSFSAQTRECVHYAMRHEMTHSNDTKRGQNIDEKYNLDKIMPKKLRLDANGKPVKGTDGQYIYDIIFDQCMYVDEFRRIGISEGHIPYAYNNTKEFIAVASEGDLSKCSPEFKQMLIDFGMPEWRFDFDN